MKFSDFLASMSDEQLGAEMRDRFERLSEAHDMNLSETHPAENWNSDNATLRRHAAAKDSMPGNSASSKEVEPTDHVADDPPRTEGTPTARGMPERPGAALAAGAAHDAALSARYALEDLQIRQSGAPDVEGRLALARARRSDPRKVRAVTEAIPGYGRIK